MVTLIRRNREPPVLTPSAIPCLRRLPTLNITEGCALGCTYCYTQSYIRYPGRDTVVLFENTADVLREELRRKRKQPARVYFSPSSDAFQYLPEVQEVTFQAMSLLLEHGIQISFCTKGFVTDRFLTLFATKPQAVFAQVGVTTLDEAIWMSFEPRTAPPMQRVETIRRLRDIGVETTARLDPLIPDLTDTDDNLLPLFTCLKAIGINSAAASFLFLRPAFARRVREQLTAWRLPSAAMGTWQYQSPGNGWGGGLMIGLEERKKRFQQLTSLAQQSGIRIRPCLCKNPELGDEDCRIAGRLDATERQKEPLLFE